MADLKPPSKISIDQVRDLAARLMADLKEEKDSGKMFDTVGPRVKDFFTQYEYGIFTEAYNAGYDDGNVDGFEHAQNGADAPQPKWAKNLVIGPPLT